MKRILLGLLMVLLLSVGTLYAKRDYIFLGAEAYLFGYPRRLIYLRLCLWCSLLCL